MNAAAMNRRKEYQIGQFQQWLRTLWPMLLFLLGIWFWMGSSEAKQIVSSSQLEKIESKLENVSQKLQEILISIEGQRKDIEYLKRSDSIQRVEKSKVDPQ